MAALDLVHDIRRSEPYQGYPSVIVGCGKLLFSFPSLYDAALCTSARPPCPAGSPSSSVLLGSSGSYHHERSPRTPLPPLAPLPAPGPVHPVPRTPMMDASVSQPVPRRRVAPPTPPPPSDDEPSVERIDLEAELEGDPEEPYLAGDAYPGDYDVYVSDASYGSERESTSVGSGPFSSHSSGNSTGSSSIGYGEAFSDSASDCASDDDLVNRHFAGTFP
ncbi:hypothetical protein PIB30_012589 [Stylosanthes scabra]|uniref:Uncharacterized protein n=1 Tax=Stylosanthes scabra TaxID=79078 RepID=A0ABU6X7L0_9FABA|nr:hypothetical protein [Stylosanthes scabra]